MVGWTRQNAERSRDDVLLAVDSAFKEARAPDFQDFSEIEVMVFLDQFKSSLSKILPEILFNSKVVFKALEAPLAILDQHFRGCAFDPEFFPKVSFAIRTQILAVFFDYRLQECHDQLLCYFAQHEPLLKGWTLSSLQRFQDFGPTRYTLYSLLKKVLPKGESEEMFEKFVLDKLPVNPSVKNWKSAYHRAKPKNRCPYVWDTLSYQEIADILVGLKKPKVDPNNHRWGFDSLGDWKDGNGINVGASLIYHFEKDDPSRSSAFREKVVPLLPNSMVVHYDPKPYLSTRFIDTELNESAKIDFNDVCGENIDRFLRLEKLHRLFAEKGNSYAYEYLKMDIADYLFDKFPGCSDEIFTLIERCLHLYDPAKSRGAGLMRYVLTTVSRRRLKFWGNVYGSPAARAVHHGVKSPDDHLLRVRPGRDLFCKDVLPGAPKFYARPRVLEWMNMQRGKGLSESDIEETIVAGFGVMEDELYGREVREKNVDDSLGCFSIAS